MMKVIVLLMTGALLLNASSQELDKKFLRQVSWSLQDVTVLEKGGIPEGPAKMLGENPELVKRLKAIKFPFFVKAATNSNDVPETIHYLVSLGITDVDLQDDYGNTALIMSADRNTPRTAQALLELGADINAAKRDSKITALHKAIISNSLDVLKVLLKHTDKQGNCVISLEAKDAVGQTALLFGLVNGGLARGKFKTEEIFKVLIEAGADVRTVSQYGDTPLHAAAKGNFAETVKLLIEKGADTGALNNSKQTPLYAAVRQKALNGAKTLLENGAKVDAMAMKLAEEGDNNDMIDLLDKYNK